MRTIIEKLTKKNVDDLLRRFRGFHDADYLKIELEPPRSGRMEFCCWISLLAKDYSNSSYQTVRFCIKGLEEFQICYHSNFDYPNVRDDIAIKWFDGKVFFDLGFAATEPQTPEDVRGSRVFFVGSEVHFDVATRD